MNICTFGCYMTSLVSSWRMLFTFINEHIRGAPKLTTEKIGLVNRWIETINPCNHIIAKCSKNTYNNYYRQKWLKETNWISEMIILWFLNHFLIMSLISCIVVCLLHFFFTIKEQLFHLPLKLLILCEL